MTTKFTLYIFLMEMAVQLDDLNVVLSWQWIPQKQKVSYQMKIPIVNPKIS